MTPKPSGTTHIGLGDFRLRLGWKVLWPVRAYLRYSPISRGKGLLQRRLIEPFLPSGPREFVFAGPRGGRLNLRYRETLGIACLLHGGFETEEIEIMCGLIRGGSTAIDVGANVGAFTIPFAYAVGPTGTVLAFEPLPDNVKRLRANVELNRLSNVRIEAQAVGDREGVAELRMSADPAYGSITDIDVQRGVGTSVSVPVTRLDEFWASLQRPEVSVLKIDVEGGEADVLLGASGLLVSQHPAILVEANAPDQLEAVSALLGKIGYRASQPRGFRSWNYLFTWSGDHDHT